MLAVTDTGIGMDAATQAQAFEPFFTTKEVGKGTGLGLATVYGIVKQSEGGIWVYSEPGRGTTFKIFLPRAASAVEPVAASLPDVQPRGGRETVLVVEDAIPVRQLVVACLSRRDYTVLEAADPDAAESLAAAHAGPIDLLISDVVMPTRNGVELARRITATRPETRVLFMSGYTRDAIVNQGDVDEGVAFIGKPFSMDALARRVRELLDAPA
jgi:CheY-like chemotaxis protein